MTNPDALTWRDRFRPQTPDDSGKNPIQRAEWRHQIRAELVDSPRQVRRGILFTLLLLLISIASALMLQDIPFWAHITGATAFDTRIALSNIYGTVTMFLFIRWLIDHWRWMSGGARAASGAIARERGGKTWESLILTGIRAHEIVMGKWWGTLRALWHGQVGFLLVRAAILLWLITPLAGWAFDPFTRIASREIPPFNIMLAFVIAFGFPLVFSAFGAGIGIFVSSFTRSETTALQISVVLLVVSVIFGVILSAVALYFTIVFTTNQFAAFADSLLMVAASIEGGALMLISLLFEGRSQPQNISVQIGIFLVGVAVYAALTGLALLAAKRIIQRGGAIR